MNLEKLVVMHKKSRDFIRGLDIQVKQELGVLLRRLQQGEILGMPQSRPLKTVHKNAFELRLRDESGIFRVIYVLVIKNKILIPHAFKKKTPKTPTKEINLSKKRLEELLNENK